MLTGIIPAYAGSTRHGHSHLLLYPDHPRISGEHQSSARQCRWRDGSSPHTRGARLRPLKDFAPRPIIPAYAGSTASRGGSAREAADHPRIRGEHRQEGRTSGLVWWIIPAYAGSTPLSLSLARGARIIPAYAGSTFPGISATHDTTDHPRIRGEHRGAPAQEGDETGSSPHTRGARTWQPQSRRRSGDHPRIRGEHAYAGIRDEPTVGSSPHTRGARRGSVKPLRCERIIPAYAGSTNTVHPYTLYNRDHPRIRGEHDTDLAGDVAEDGSSPHTRGAPMAPVSHSRRGGIIPAYAGSTRATLYEVSVVPDHPRIRGEHFGIEESLVSGEGSSPHTRGAPNAEPGRRFLGGIIPAYAGSTRRL